jgi:GNAT superfamily N-acetyltransferase
VPPETKTTHILEMLDPGDLRPVRVKLAGLRIERMEVKLPEFNKFLHTLIGQPYRWGGRTTWGKEEWYAFIHRPGRETWVAYVYGTPAGYFELGREPEGDVHIIDFGLVEHWIGQGLGGHLLTAAVERAWEMGAKRVWLSTCSHDHPHALQNYLARGFRIQRIVQGPANPAYESFWELVEGARDRSGG